MSPAEIPTTPVAQAIMAVAGGVYVVGLLALLAWVTALAVRECRAGAYGMAVFMAFLPTMAALLVLAAVAEWAGV